MKEGIYFFFINFFFGGGEKKMQVQVGKAYNRLTMVTKGG
jgi:hypothetical protein